MEKRSCRLQELTNCLYKLFNFLMEIYRRVWCCISKCEHVCWDCCCLLTLHTQAFWKPVKILHSQTTSYLYSVTCVFILCSVTATSWKWVTSSKQKPNVRWFIRTNSFILDLWLMDVRVARSRRVRSNSVVTVLFTTIKWICNYECYLSIGQ